MHTLNRSSSDLSKPFSPAIGLRGGHLQTLFPALFRKIPDLNMEIETFELSDGDFLDCFWYQKPKEQKENKPIVVLFHGLEGSHKSQYIRGMMQRLSSEGYSSVLMHFRGCSGRDNRLARCYHSGETEDAKAWISKLTENYPNNKLYAIGYSLGGNMLLKLLGEYGEKSPLKAAISVSAPMQLDISANKMNRGFSKIYQYHLMKDLKKSLLRKYKKHDMQSLIGVDPKSVKKMKSFWEFDDKYTGPVHGFGGAKNYYAKSSAKQYLKTIKTPTLIIQALDDPFMTPEILPKHDEISASVELAISAHGGHVGFVSGNIFNPKYWLEEKVLAHFNKLNSEEN